MAGPVAEPTRLTLIKGNPSKKTIPDNEPKPPPVPVNQEPYFELVDEHSKRMWTYALGLLNRMKVMTSADVIALTRYCDLYGRWRIARDFILANGEQYAVYEKQGRIIKWERSQEGHDIPVYAAPRILSARRYPQSILYETYHKELLRMEREFGLTPSARTAVEGGRGGSKDDDEDFLFGS